MNLWSVLSFFFPQARDKDLRQRSCIPLILAVCRRLVAYELSNSLVCVCVCLSVIQSFNLFFHFAGLSREGWYIVKNLLTEMTVLLAGFFTFVPAVQVNAPAFSFKFALFFMYICPSFLCLVISSDSFFRFDLL